MNKYTIETCPFEDKDIRVGTDEVLHVPVITPSDVNRQWAVRCSCGVSGPYKPFPSLAVSSWNYMVLGYVRKESSEVNHD